MSKKRLMGLFIVALVALLALAACGEDDSPSDADAESPAPATFSTVDVQQAHDALEADDDAIIVDVRTAQEWADTGVPPGAQLITLDDVGERAADELPTDRPIYVICNSGNRSRVASEELIDLGYTQIYNVDGGIQAWLQAGLPVEPYAP